MKRSKFDILFIIIAFSVVLGVIIYINRAIDNYQFQIDQRDSIINESTLREDSLRNNNTELINSLNRLFKETKLEYDGTFDVAKFIEKHNSLRDTINQLNGSLELIKDNYGISTRVYRRTTKDNRTITTISVVGTEKIDSALILLPYFRDRLILKKGGGYTVMLFGKEHLELRSKRNKEAEQYNDLLKRYNILADRQAKDIKDYNSLLEKYNELHDGYKTDVNFYKDLLKRLAKKDLIKIDSLEDGSVTYKY